MTDSEVVVCGDGAAGEGEECGGDDLEGASCASLGYSGTLACAPDCRFDTDRCTVE